MSNTKRIVKWNDQRGFLKQFDFVREVSYTLSEEFELMHWQLIASMMLHAINNSKAQEGLEIEFEKMKIEIEAIVHEEKYNHDDLASWFARWFLRHDVTDVEFIDKCTDQKVFLTGGLAKCTAASTGEYDVDKLSDAISAFDDAVMTANECKPIGKVKESGKQEKGEGFDKISPEGKIYDILKGMQVIED